MGTNDDFGIKKIKKDEYEPTVHSNTKDKEIKPWEVNGALETKADMAFIIHMFGSNIYHSDESAFREQIVNALSHGALPVLQAGQEAWVEVTFDYAERSITIQDMNGMGIPWKDFDKICRQLGQSGNTDGTRAGQHGCGLFSFLKLSNLVTLETWSKVTDEHYAFLGREGKVWEPIENRTLEVTGTKVTLTCKPEVDLDKIVDYCKIVCDHFPIVTNVSVKNRGESTIESYGKIQDGVIQLGNRTYEMDMIDEYSRTSGKTVSSSKQKKALLKLSNDLLDIYIMKYPGQGTTNVKTYLTNVPIELFTNKTSYGSNQDPFQYHDTMGQLGNVILSIKNERDIHPPVDRDTLNQNDTNMIVQAAEDLMKKWVKENVKFKTIKEYINHSEKWIVDNHSIDDMVDDKTRDIIHKTRQSYYGSISTEHKHSLSEYLVKYDKVLLVKTTNSRLQSAIRNWSSESIGFLNIVRKTDEDKQKWLLRRFELATDYRKTNKIKLPKLDTETYEKGEIRGTIKVYYQPSKERNDDMSLQEIHDSGKLKTKPTTWKEVQDDPKGSQIYFRVPFDSLDNKFDLIGDRGETYFNLNNSRWNLIASAGSDRKLSKFTNVLFLPDVIEILKNVKIETNVRISQNAWKDDERIEKEIYAKNLLDLACIVCTGHLGDHPEINIVYRKDQAIKNEKFTNRKYYAILKEPMKQLELSVLLGVLSTDKHYELNKDIPFTKEFLTEFVKNEKEMCVKKSFLERQAGNKRNYFSKPVLSDVIKIMSKDSSLNWINSFSQEGYEIVGPQEFSFSGYRTNCTMMINDAEELVDWIKTLPKERQAFGGSIALYHMDNLDRDVPSKVDSDLLVYKQFSDPSSKLFLPALKDENLKSIEKNKEVYKKIFDVIQKKYYGYHATYTYEKMMSKLIPKDLSLHHELIRTNGFIERNENETFEFEFKTITEMVDFLNNIKDKSIKLTGTQNVTVEIDDKEHNRISNDN